MNSENKQHDTDKLNVLDGNYILGACLLKSATGDIYPAWDTSVDIKNITSASSSDFPPQFFIKFLPDSFSDSDDIKQIIDKEIQRLTDCFDWSKIIAFEKKPDRAYLVLQLPRGDFFGQQFNSTKIYGDLSTVLPLLSNINVALNILRDCGIQHGRIEPNSLFIIDNGDVGLIDSLYVSAKQRLLAQETDNTSTVPNKEALYASPDICFGREVSEQDNVFSLACICYHLLSGKHPFNGNNSVSALLNKIRPEPITTLSNAQWQHLEYGLSLAKESRIETVIDFIKGFDLNAKPFAPLNKKKEQETAIARKKAQRIIEQQRKRKRAKRAAKKVQAQQKTKTTKVQPSPIKQQTETVEWAWIPLSILTGMIVGSLAITLSINIFDMNFFSLIGAIKYLF
jgi:serine/threonine protein kinase